jgi:serine/threonine-protein kinase
MTGDNDNGDDLPPTVAAESDATTIVPPPTEAAPELAWSKDDGDADNAQPWHEAWGRTPIIVFIAALAAFAIAVVGWFSIRPHHNQHVASLPSTMAAAAPPPISTTPPAPTGPRLDGTYQIAYDDGATTYTGKAAPPKRTGIETVWWAFHSSCTAAGCTASGVKLDNADHSVRMSRGDFISTTLTYTGGQWVNGATSIPAHIPGCDTASTHWTLQPQSDGTLSGVETVTIEGDCTSTGNGIATPITATRIGPVPAGVL